MNGFDDVPAHAAPAMLSRWRVFVALIQLLKANGRWWLIPFVLVMALTAVLMVVVSVVEYVAPFVYTIF